MPQYNPETMQYEETDNERKQRERLGNTEVGKKEVTTYADGSQTHTTTQEVPAPGFFDKLGTEVSQAGTNFVNNIQNAPNNFANNVQQGFKNVTNAPSNFVNNVSNLGNTQPQASQQPIGPVAPTQTQPAFTPNYSLSTGEGAPGLRYGQAFAPQEAMQPITPVAPVNPQQFNQQAYNASIGAQESGNRPNIGMHNPALSSAYGQYGLTNAAYQDARRLNPNLPTDITQATPEQQTTALNSYTQQNAKALQGYGIQPNQNNLQAAHFLGAKGLNDYLSTGYISPQAAAANGGIENVKRIVDQRLGGQAAAASGATGRPLAMPGEGVAVATGNGVLGTQSMNQPAEAPAPVNPEQLSQYNLATGYGNQGIRMPGIQPGQPAPITNTTTMGINAYQQAQNDIPSLLKLSTDDNQPEFIRQRAGDQAMQLYKNKRDEQTATEKLATLTPKQVADVAQGRDKSSVGDWLQYLLFKHVGLTDLANEKGEQLGIGHKWQGAMDAEGNAGMVQYTASGKPLMGIKEDGTQMSPAELTAYASMGDSKNIHVGATPHHGIVNGETHTFATRTVNGQMQYKDSSVPDSKWSTKAPEGFSTLGYQDPQHLKGLSAASAVSTKMEKANADAMAVGGRPLYTPQQIADAKNSSYMGMTGKQFPGMNAPISNAPISNVPITNAPAANAPAVNAPVANAPVANAPVANAPAVNAPKSQAQSILDYESPPPVGPTTPAKIALQNEVQKLAQEQGKTYDAGQYKILNKTRQDFITGPQGKIVSSMNTAVAHLDTLDDAGKALHSGQIPISNKIVKEFATQLGLPQYTSFESIKHVVGSEIAKAVAGSGGSALADRQAIEKEFDSASSPDQLNGVIGRYKELMAGQLISQKQTFVSSGLKAEEFDRKLLPRTQKVINGTQAPTRSTW